MFTLLLLFGALGFSWDRGAGVGGGGEQRANRLSGERENSLSSLLPSSFQISPSQTPKEGLIVSQVTMLLSLFVVWLILLEFVKRLSPNGNFLLIFHHQASF